MELKFRELLNIEKVRFDFIGEASLLEQAIDSFCIDSRVIESDQTFIAIKGDRHDGHDFIAEVVAKGARAILASRSWYHQRGDQIPQGNYFLVNDTLEALQAIAHYYRQKFPIPIVAVTGSNGKTTTREMIATVLEQKYHVLKNLGNLNNHIGVPLTLLNLAPVHQLGVIEMGTNHPGEIARLAEIACPTAGLITNIGPAHLEFFGSLEGVFEAKTELWRYLEQAGELAFVNVDDPLLAKRLPATKRMVTYGFENPAQISGRFLGLDNEGRAAFAVNRVAIQLKIAGMHNIYNGLAAVAVGLEFGLALEPIKSALEAFSPASKRMEVIRKDGVVIINDCYNSNPESARKALLTLSQMKALGKRIAVLGDMLELGHWARSEHESVGRYVATLGNIQSLLTFGELSLLTAKEAQRQGMKNVFYFNDKSKLIEQLKRMVSDGDVILIKGSRGMAMEQVTAALIAEAGRSLSK
ncbi:MAG: UDP-N-acetylmuramoyl-tripeptide--D-alanyl-D-alanine ligase [candidate division KSB1 bacterium]|nr:UDP-N-acetylmuramoyl-tripeptide--D-alanyl-D-alanine ligase [candidate division KSB1 bacterium]